MIIFLLMLSIFLINIDQIIFSINYKFL